MPNYWFDHVHLNSPDPIKTAEFYEKMFGARRVGLREMADGRTMVDLDLSGTSIKVTHPRAQPLRGERATPPSRKDCQTSGARRVGGHQLGRSCGVRSEKDWRWAHLGESRKQSSM